MKTTQLQNAIIAASIIGSILSAYDYKVARERTKNIGVLQSRIRKFLFSRSRTNAKEFNEAVEIADAAWGKTIKQFQSKGTQIETVTAIAQIYALYDKQLARFVNVTEKQMNSYTAGAEKNLSYEIEKNSQVFMDFMLGELAQSTGVVQKTLNLMQKAEVI